MNFLNVNLLFKIMIFIFWLLFFSNMRFFVKIIDNYKIAGFFLEYNGNI